MTISRVVRQSHHWIAIIFTLSVITGFVVRAISPGSEWVNDVPLSPLTVLMFSCLYLFVQPYLREGPHEGKKQWP